MARWSRIEKKLINSLPINHCPTSEGVTKVSKRASKWGQRRARAKQAVRSKKTSERCKRTSEQMSDWPSTAVWFLDYFGPQWDEKDSFTMGQNNLILQHLLLTFPWAQEWMCERCERTSKCTSGWPRKGFWTIVPSNTFLNKIPDIFFSKRNLKLIDYV